jgi:hypothetical protein
MVKLTGNPKQPFALGVILIVALPLTGLNDGISVTPILSLKPIEVPPVMSKTTDEGVPFNPIIEDIKPLHRF